MKPDVIAVVLTGGSQPTPGAGLLLANPQKATGLRFGAPTDFGDAPAGVGVGLRLINPQGESGLILGTTSYGVTPPIPVAPPTINNVYATGSTTAQVQYTDNQTAPADSFDVYVTEVGVGEISGSPFNTTNNPYGITGLTAETTYSIQMTAIVGAAVSGFSNAVEVTTDAVGQPGDFIPMIFYQFEGTVGQHISSPNFMWNSGNTIYSNDQVKYGSTSARPWIEEASAGDSAWGGGITPSLLTTGVIDLGAEIWVSMWMYVPTSFEAPALASTPPGSTCSQTFKWMRWRKRTKSAPTENRGYIDLFLRPGAYCMASEISDPVGLETYVMGTYPFQSGSWVRWEWYNKLSNVSDGIQRLWRNGVLIAEDLGAKQLALADEYLSDYLFLTYFNCNSPQTQWMYIDNLVIATSESPPTNTDSSGNIMIGNYTG